jgi:signal transduction histidine kinase
LRASGDLVVETDIHPAQVRGDAAKLGQVVRNLADNARQQARRRVRIGLREHEGSAVVLIDDDGPGIPAADRGRVFERFVRLDESRARGSGGSGLGLSIVHEIVKGHGGRVTISDSPLGGARFEVRFSSKR